MGRAIVVVECIALVRVALGAIIGFGNNFVYFFTYLEILDDHIIFFNIV